MEGAEEIRLCAVLSRKCAVAWAPVSTLVPKESVSGSRPDVETEVGRRGGEVLLSVIVRETVAWEAVLVAVSREEWLLVSTKGGLVVDIYSRPLLPILVSCECVEP